MVTLEVRPMCGSCGNNFARRAPSSNGEIYYRPDCTSCERKKRGYRLDNKKKHRDGFTTEEIMAGCKCGFIPLHPCQMDVHHIDGNHKNNAKENKELLCANCHRLERVNRQ